MTSVGLGNPYLKKARSERGRGGRPRAVTVVSSETGEGNTKTPAGGKGSCRWKEPLQVIRKVPRKVWKDIMGKS